MESQEAGVSLSSGHSRLEEMKVELAWLADPATFSLSLGARAVGANLEVRGYVPNEAVKERALELARQHSFLPVTDALKLHPSLALHSGGVPSEEVRKEAAALLAEAFGERGRSLTCEAKAGGQVLVSGHALSVEDKLEVSRRLKQVHGCLAVINRVNVATTVRDGKKVTLVTSDGTQLVQGELPDLDKPARESESIQVEKPMILPSMEMPGKHDQPRAVVTPWVPPAVTPPVPQTTGTARSPYAPNEAPARSLSAPNEMPMPRAVKHPTPAVPTGSDTARPTVRESKPLTTLDDEPESLPVPRVVPPKASPATPAQPDELPPPRPLILPPSKGSSSAKPEKTDSLQTTKHVVPSDKKDGSLDLLTPPPVPVSWSGGVSTSEKKVSAPAVRKEDGPKVKEAKEPDAPYVTTGVVIFEDAPARKTGPTVAAGKLKQRVEKACGRFAKSVKVVVQPDKSLVVKVMLVNAAAERPLTERIMQLPEMGSPEVKLEMEIAP
jgi:hypothetical protein